MKGPTRKFTSQVSESVEIITLFWISWKYNFVPTLCKHYLWLCLFNFVPVLWIVLLGWTWASPTIMWMCSWNFCMYVCTVVIPYYHLIQDNFGKKQTIALTHRTSSPCTIPCHIHSSFNMGSDSKDTAELEEKLEGKINKLDNKEKQEA